MRQNAQAKTDKTTKYKTEHHGVGFITDSDLCVRILWQTVRLTAGGLLNFMCTIMAQTYTRFTPVRFWAPPSIIFCNSSAAIAVPTMWLQVVRQSSQFGLFGDSRPMGSLSQPWKLCSCIQAASKSIPK